MMQSQVWFASLEVPFQKAESLCTVSWDNMAEVQSVSWEGVLQAQADAEQLNLFITSLQKFLINMFH